MFTTRDSKGDGGHHNVFDDHDEYEYDPDFEFDAPQWIDIAADHPHIDKYDSGQIE